MAKHSLVNEKVLIKVLEKKLLRLNKDLSKLETEIQILRNIRHQNIIQLFEVHISNI
jgi:serine/threonine protein kinase